MCGSIILFVSWAIFTLGHCSKSVQEETFRHDKDFSPCSYSKDTHFGGIVVNCQGRGLIAAPESEWIPSQTTSLLLQGNSIPRLDEDSFPTARQLRYLSLADNHLASIDPNAFRCNQELQFLDLQGNRLRLDEVSFTGPWFGQLHSLKEMRLADNQNGDSWNSLYPPRLLEGLTSLRTLTLDTFGGDLDFNGIFNHTKTLFSLSLGGGITAIRNESFKGFASIELKELIINYADYLVTTETGAFRYLRSLVSFSLYGGLQGLKTTFESLAPFVDRNMTTLLFHEINFLYNKKEVIENDGVLTNHLDRYLSKICIQHFTLTHSFIFIVDRGVFTNPLWSRCLVSLDLSGNPLMGNWQVLILLSRLKALRVLRLRNRKFSIYNHGNRIPGRSPFRLSPANDLNFPRGKSDSLYDKFEDVFIARCFSLITRNENKLKSDLGKKTEFDDAQQFSEQQSHWAERSLQSHAKFRVPFWFPENIVSFYMDGFGGNTLRFHSPVKVLGGHHLREIHASDAGLSEMIQHIRGIEGVKVLDLSRNDGSQMTSAFLGSFPNVSHLNLSKVLLSITFSSPGSSCLFNSLTLLENLDLSNNDLYTLPLGIFATSNLLNVLNLAGNRFNVLPTKDKLLPSLQVIDMGGNSLLRFTADEVIYLEKKAQLYPTFSLILSGNVFSCGCSSIKFLHWLQITHITLDNHKNYSCILENGRITTTSAMKDTAALWRHCNGETAFLVSLVLLSMLILCVSLLWVYIKFQTQIVAVVFQYFSLTFTLKTPGDYPRGVYVGYADKDADFACGRLREFVEGQLGLSTYIRHRDQVPGSDMAGSTVTAINSCWRILLVISPDYLADQWSFLAMKSSMYAVSSLNPGRLVLVVLSYDGLGQRIPACVLTAVREESIVHVADEAGDWTALEKQELRNALLP